MLTLTEITSLVSSLSSAKVYAVRKIDCWSKLLRKDNPQIKGKTPDDIMKAKT